MQGPYAQCRGRTLNAGPYAYCRGRTLNAGAAVCSGDAKTQVCGQHVFVKAHAHQARLSRCGLRGIRIGEASHPGPRRPRGSGSSDASRSQRSRFAPLSTDDSDTEELVDNVAGDDVLDALELDLAGEALTVVDTIDPMVHDDLVQEGSGSDGAVETVIWEGPDPDAQADHSPEPDMADSQLCPKPIVPEVRPSARTQAGFAALDLINVGDIFTQRACVMKVPPAFLRGAYHSAMRTALSEIVAQQHQSCQRLTPEDALVQASQGRQSAQERSLGPVQVRGGSVVGSLDPERGNICNRIETDH